MQLEKQRIGKDYQGENKDRPQEEVNERVRNAPSIAYPEGKSPEMSEYDPKNIQDVYTLGMEERDKRKESDGPGPGAHNIETNNWRGPAFKKNDPAKETVVDRDHTGPSSYNIVLKSRAPKHSFGAKGSGSAIGVGYRNRGPKNTGPGPGTYENKDVQFKKPCTKFSTAAKQSLMKMEGPSRSLEFDPVPPKVEADKFSFPRTKRFDSAKDSVSRHPGPGEYEVLNQLPKGKQVSMLGGSLDPPGIVDNGVPGPGNYFSETGCPNNTDNIPGIKMISGQERFKPQKILENDGANQDNLGDLPPQNGKGWSIGKGLRDPLKSKFETPAPNAYDITEFAPIEIIKGEDKEK